MRLAHTSIRIAFALAVIPPVSSCSVGEERRSWSTVDGELNGIAPVLSSGGTPLLVGPVAMHVGSDGSLYAMNQDSGSVSRIDPDGVEHRLRLLGVPVAGLRNSIAVAFASDSPFVVDSAGRQVYVFSPSGHHVRTIQLAATVTDPVIDGRKRQIIGRVYGADFAWQRGRAVVTEDSLVAMFSLDDGTRLASLGRPREYEGRLVPIVANHVELALAPTEGRIWLAWPLDGMIRVYASATGTYDEYARPLDQPLRKPIESDGAGPLPKVDAEIVTHDVAATADGRRLIVLTTTASAQEQGGDGRAVEVLDFGAAVRCRIPVAFRVVRLAALDSDGIVLIEEGLQGRVVRATYSCPRTAERSVALSSLRK